MLTNSSGVLLLLLLFLWGSHSELLDSRTCSCRPVYEKCSAPPSGKSPVKCFFPTKPCCTHKTDAVLTNLLESLNESTRSKRDASQRFGPSPGKSANSKTCSCVSSNQCEDGNLDFTFGTSCGFGMVRCCVMSRGVQLPYNIVHKESTLHNNSSSSTNSPVFNPKKQGIPTATSETRIPVIKVQGSNAYLQPTTSSGDPNNRPERQTKQPAALRPGQVTSLPAVPRFPLPGKPISFPKRPNQPPQPSQQVSLPQRPRPGQPTSLSRHPRPPYPVGQPPIRRPSPLLKKTQYNPLESGPNHRRPPPRLSPQEIEELRKRDAAKRAYFENQRRHQEQMLQKRRLERLKNNRPTTKEKSTLENIATIFQRFFG